MKDTCRWSHFCFILGYCFTKRSRRIDIHRLGRRKPQLLSFHSTASSSCVCFCFVALEVKITYCTFKPHEQKIDSSDAQIYFWGLKCYRFQKVRNTPFFTKIDNCFNFFSKCMNIYYLQFATLYNPVCYISFYHATVDMSIVLNE